MKSNDIDSFWAKVDIKGLDECWPWKLSKSNEGYGRFSFGDRCVRAHRFAYQVSHGEIPNGLRVLHTCDNPTCCNPTHLWIGTDNDNCQDKIAKGRAKYPGARNPSRGDEHYSRIHPEKMARGERHGSRTKPESRRHGDNHPARLHPERMARGEANGSSKLTVAEVEQIKSLYRHERGSISKLSRMFGVSRKTILNIVTGKVWKDVQPIG
jgi:hypothetical protein